MANRYINFRLTSSATNSTSDVETFAQADYVASGILETRERDFVGTRNGRIITNAVAENVDYKGTLLLTLV